MLGFLNSVFKTPRPVNNVFHSRTVMSATAPRSPSSNGMGILITGSTKGVGRALAEHFLSLNDNVVISSRSEENVQNAIVSIRQTTPNGKLYGYMADVSKHEEVERLLDFAVDALDSVDAVICNAGTVGDIRGPLVSQNPNSLKEVIETNLLGSIFCSKEAIRISNRQNKPIHVFLMDGSGTRGNSTPGYCAYGATKRSIPQLVASLNAETKNQNVRFHKLSPGMVLTNLLLKGNKNNSPMVRRIFNFLAEEPETVAEELVPQIKYAIKQDKRNLYIAYLTATRALYRLSTGFVLGFRRNLFFDEASGNRIDNTAKYDEDGVKIRE